MAIITTPGAGVSPYQTSDADPTVLRAGANGATVLANAATAAATADTGANTSVYVAGQAALNSLITSNQPGVFQGANVNITLEEQNFNTTNQVTSTTNYASGAAGSIQYNNGGNGFAGDAYFTYTDSNVITPGIRTDGYFYSNGTPFTGGGNAAIGNFVFTGDAMTIAHANSTLSVTGNGTGNVNITANGNTWTFKSDGNLTLPAAGNIVGAVNIIGNGTGNVNINANGRAWTFAADGNLVLPIAGNIVNNGYTWNFGTTGILTLPGNSRVAPVGANIELQAAAGGYAEITTSDGNTYVSVDGSGAQIVANSSNIWAFNNNGTTQFPANVIQAPAGSPITVRATSGNASSRLAAGDNFAQIGLQDDTTGAYQAWAYVETDMANVNTPSAVVILKPGDTGNEVRWNFDATGNLSLPGNIIAINYANGNRVTGNVTFRDEIVIGTGTSNLISGLYLAPSSSSADANMYLRVRGNIVDEPTHIHFDTGNNAYYNQFIGDDNKYIQLANTGNIVINSNDAAGNSAQWTFGTDGNLTIPGNIIGANVISANAFTNLTGAGNVLIQSSENQAGPIATWTFDPVSDGTGNMIFPTGMHVTTDGYGGTRISQNSSNSTVGLKVTSGNNASLVTGWNEQEIVGVGNVALAAFNFDNSPGNIKIITGNLSATSYLWNFDKSGNLTFPTGNLVIIPDLAAESNAAVISSTDHVLALVSNGVNGGVQSVWVEDVANIGTSNIAAVRVSPISQTGNVQIQTGNNSSYNTWTFSADGNLTLPGSLIVPANSIITGVGASPAPSINGFDTINAITFSASGNITGSYFFGNGSQLTDVGAASVPGQTILPTIQTITVSDTSGVGNAGGGGSAFANVTVANVTPVTEYGVIVTSGTSSQKYATGALGSIPGTVQLTFSTGLNSTPFTVYAYVTSNAGTYYSNSATGTSGICLLAGTQIALSDGTHKAIEDITYTDKILSWDFDRGCYAETTAMWIKRSETGSQYNLLTFSDGTTLRTFDQHRIFNKQAGAFTYPMTAATPVGTVTVNEHGQEITLTNKQVIKDNIEYYNVITDYHMNLFSDSVLTSCRFNNIYPITDMKFAKDSRTLRTRAEFENIEDRFFHGLRLAEQTTDIETVEWYVNRLLRTEVSTHAELAV